MAAGLRAIAFAMASPPLRATSVPKPARSSCRVSSSAAAGSSSTTRMRGREASSGRVTALGADASWPGAWMGRPIVNTLPLLGSLFRLTSPPCSLAKRRVSVSPRPVPGWERPTPESTCWNS